MGKRYLIIKTSSLGDIVHTIPVVSYLKACEPDCQIDWVAEKVGAELLKALPLVDRVLTINTKKWRSHPFSPSTWKEFSSFIRQLREYSYDMVFDLQGNVKSGIFTCFSKAGIKGGFGKTTVPEWPNLWFTNKQVNPPAGLNITEDYLYVVSRLLGRECPVEVAPVTFNVTQQEILMVDTLLEGGKTCVLLAPGSAWENKKASEAQLIDLLNQQPKEARIFLLWGSEQEFLVCQNIAPICSNASILPKLTLAGVQYLMSKMDLVISMDSLPLHLAAITGVPTLSFFGPSNGKKYAPKGAQHRFIQGSCPYGEVFEKRCRKLRSCPTGSCIKNLNLTSLNSKNLSVNS